MSRTTPLVSLSASHSASATVASDVPLPLRATDFDAGLASLLHEALRGARRTDVLNDLCRHLARTLRLRLVLLLRREEPGAFSIEGASEENALWLELQRIPERWDGGVTSRGPAGEALRTLTPIRMRVDDEGFVLWRSGAESELVREILALPIAEGGDTRVLELYFGHEIARGASIGTLTMGQLVHRIEQFLADLRLIEQQRLLANALAGAGNAAMVTDLEGTIVWINRAFSELSGYAAEEVVGRNPSLLHSGEQGVRYYRDLWGTIRAGEVWSGETVDRAKDGQNYTIHQTVSPVSHDGRVTHYLSLQQDIDVQKKERAALERATRLSPGTGLLTRTAFEDAAREALASAEGQAVALVLLSLRGLQRGAAALDEERASVVAAAMGARVCKGSAASDLAASWGPYEYALLWRGDVNEARARVSVLIESLREPLHDAADLPELDAHYGIAATDGSSATFQDLRLRADRQLADEPYRRARRETR